MAAHDHTHDGRGSAARASTSSIDLTRLSLTAGEGYRHEFAIDPGTLVLGGSDYRLSGAPVDARLDVSRTAAGYALRLRFAGELAGPCMRCLEPATEAVEVDAREVDQPSSEDEELRSPYVIDGVLELAAWAHDALALALPIPPRIVCRAECEGLCAVCGEPLAGGTHEHEREPDPRWAKLRELQE